MNEEGLEQIVRGGDKVLARCKETERINQLENREGALSACSLKMNDAVSRKQ